ncbi:hypothetical protein [Novosphingopyxis sp. YJ-S2-01]|uniref:hypothetical protein n=1 Tax=Novosphingopyxis sp. YJ-S2-01 TaxID=2794021 RepID=UPI0018DD1FEF|nr:hypothetical protein [Novosphingopyxis sp. YJ-S2-01]MBH9536912.1 hypothetical protein [Novosphingopyxis sp. YJ-S2-01]
MALPVKALLIAAKIAQDERAQKAAATLFSAGSAAFRKRVTKKETVDPLVIAPDSLMKSGTIPRKRKFRGGQTGDLIRVRYEDEDGLVAIRTIGNWTSDGRTMSGYCLNRKGPCELAVARIEAWEDVPLRR